MHTNLIPFSDYRALETWLLREGFDIAGPFSYCVAFTGGYVTETRLASGRIVFSWECK